MYPAPMPASVGVDGTDHEIIDLLRGDARRTLADIASRVSLSAPAVKRRIDRLVALGVIVGYTIEVDHAKLGRPVEALIELSFAGKTPVDAEIATAERVAEVDAMFTIAGAPDALVHVRADDVDHLRKVIDQLRRSRGVIGTRTCIVLSRWSRPSGRGRRYG
jgi:Lrp/AsnC family transcriptional regulator, leucine-responsive regulatory protein